MNFDFSFSSFYPYSFTLLGRMNSQSAVSFARFQLATASFLWILVGQSTKFEDIPAERITSVHTAFAALGDEIPLLLYEGYHIFDIVLKLLENTMDEETAGNEVQSILSNMNSIAVMSFPLEGLEVSVLNQLSRQVLVWLWAVLPQNKRGAKAAAARDKRMKVILNAINALVQLLQREIPSKGTYSKLLREKGWENGV